MTVAEKKPGTISPSGTAKGEKAYYAEAGFHQGGVVRVREGEATRPLRHHVLHSPDGFAWGYGGSGPTELARCMLLDFLFGDDPANGELDLPVSYHDFRDEVIAHLSQDHGWEIPGALVGDWIKGRG